MTNPTTNFGWVMPTATDLVTDLPADFNVFGQGVDTSMADLLGGTTGQILSKTSATDMDFTWIANDQGDITEVNTTAPLAGGATSGAVTLSVTTATTSATGVVQLSDSTSTTSSVLAATPTAVKSAYDLATAAIAKSTVTTAGDIIYRNATVPTRLGIGTAGQVLQVNSGATAPEWATASSAGKTYTLVNAGGTALSGSSTAISGLSSYDNLLIIISGASFTTANQGYYMTVNAVQTANSYTRYGLRTTSAAAYAASNAGTFASATGTTMQLASMSTDAASTMSGGVMISGCRGTGVKPYNVIMQATAGSGSGNEAALYYGVVTATTVISSIEIIGISATFDAGTVFVYGAV